MTDLNKMASEMLANAEARQRNRTNIATDTFHMLKHCATEVVEAARAWARFKMTFPFDGESERKAPFKMNVLVSTEKAFASKLAYIIACCLIIAGKEQIDIEDALIQCQKKNRLRAEGKGDKK